MTFSLLLTPTLLGTAADKISPEDSTAAGRAEVYSIFGKALSVIERNLGSGTKQDEMVIALQNIRLLYIDTCLTLGDFTQATKLMQRAKELNTHQNRIKYYEAKMYEVNKNFSKARALYDEILLQNGNDFETLLCLANLTFRQDENAELALTYLDQAVKLNAEAPSLWFLYGEVYESLQDSQSTAQYYRKAVDLSYVSPILPYNVIPRY